MPNIKYKKGSFLFSRGGEIMAVSVAGCIVFTLLAVVVGMTAEFVSTTVYPFSYPFLHSPLHSFLPKIVLDPPLISTLIFAALFSLGIYYFEKNIFYRRISLALKAGFAAIAACSFVFISSLITILADVGGVSLPSTLLYSADVNELPALFIYYYLTSLPIFFVCGQIRRRIFSLP